MMRAAPASINSEMAHDASGPALIVQKSKRIRLVATSVAR